MRDSERMFTIDDILEVVAYHRRLAELARECAALEAAESDSELKVRRALNEAKRYHGRIEALDNLAGRLEQDLVKNI